MPPPVSYLKIVNCHLAPAWSPKTGTNIGGVAPASFGMQQGTVDWQNKPWPVPAALLHAQNAATKPGYADWLSGGVFHLPETCTGHLQMGVTFYVDEGFIPNAQAMEMDTKITDANQITYNGSLQFECSSSATEMLVQIDKAGGGWVNTGISIPKFEPGTEHAVLIEYEFDIASKTSSVVSITVDGVLHLIPDNMWSIPGTNNAPHPWAPNEILPQLQQDVKPIANAAWSWLVTDMFYNVW